MKEKVKFIKFISDSEMAIVDHVHGAMCGYRAKKISLAVLPYRPVIPWTCHYK